MKQVVLPRKIKIGYGLCESGPSTTYNLFFIYFVFFLTVVAGVPPAIAGMISFIALAVDAIIVPFLGIMSDNYVTKKGRRMPWMKATIVPMTMIYILIFAPFEFGNPAVQIVYYTLIATATWVLYGIYAVPYLALAPEITTVENERNMLRSTAMIVGYTSTLLASSGPMWIWAWAYANGLSDGQAWGISGTVFAFLALAAALIGIILIKGCEKDSIEAALKAKQEKTKPNFAKEWASCLKVKCFRKSIVWIFLYMVGIMMGTTVFVHAMTFNAELTAEEQGVFWIVYGLVVIGSLPISTAIANRIGKKLYIQIAFTVGTVVGLFYFFSGINNLLDMYIYGMIIGVVIGAFYIFYIAFVYDSVEIGEFKTGVRQDGAMVSLAMLMFKLGAAVGMFLAGIVLQVTGFDGMEYIQSAGALQGILAALLLVPGIFSLLSIIVMATYPVNRENLKLLCDALEKKRAGQEYSTEGFEKIL